MAKTGTQENQPPPGYPTATENPPPSPTGEKFRPRTKAKGERGFIEGCSQQFKQPCNCYRANSNCIAY
ncbi:cysteine-rich and transmembrane domain-containing protein A [Pyrus ussuriensis x Pyrus communis]|uniref:Cysteine-rich and transmembrane domain-containing protein A n=1 Tax=Pyrus ussuriensis x Pyrus communis TaxID=2448454 RepID=A0A5N5G3S5_9ROSA|nr:cysteine-rich and transmembrane domain-containing protein A [Pyrus ussuriensis x Pyrus communis]